MQWNQNRFPYLRRDIWEVQNPEQTQEVRLPEGMPDIGRVLCAWGQPVLRSKEWRGDAVGISGGVNTWVLYVPEDGTMPQCMEAWLPFQAKFSLPESRREGVIRANCCLRSVDARALSSRKLLVRASVGLLAEALEQEEAVISSPGEQDGELQLLRKTYPAVLPREAGEKVFTLEEEGPDLPVGLHKVVCCRLQPVITEQNVMGSRAVFKGKCKVQGVYMTDDGRLKSFLASYPFAQYADLDREYDRDAEISVMLEVSNLEHEVQEGNIHIKCGLVAQYVIFDRQMTEVTEDAYSPFRQITADTELLQLPMMLDRKMQTLEIAGKIPAEAAEIVDMTLFTEPPIQYREGQQIQGQVPGSVQLLYYDEAQQLQLSTENLLEQWNLPMEEGGMAFVSIAATEARCNPVTQDQVAFDGEITLEMLSVAQQNIPMITGIRMGERREPDPDRPSLILRRAGEDSLWDIAKRCGSTVEDIRKANQLTDEPAPDRMLLIPIC